MKRKKDTVSHDYRGVNGKKCEGLLDIGSQYSMMSVSMAKDLGLWYTNKSQ